MYVHEPSESPLLLAYRRMPRKITGIVTPEPIVSVVANSAVSCACDATIGAYRGLARQLYEKALKGVIAGLRPRLRT